MATAGDDAGAARGSAVRPRAPGSIGLTFRRRWRTVLFVLITLWLCAVVAVVLTRGLPNAERSGTAEELAAQYQRYLGKGWFPLELAPLPSGPRWLGLNYSSGTSSTIRPARSWASLRLRLAPVGCRGDQPLTIRVDQGAHALKAIVPPAGWTWVTVPLFERAAPVTLHYSCVSVQQSPVGAGRAQLAVLLSGVTR